MNIKDNGIDDFDAFVKRQQTASAGEDRVDWAKERDDWLGHLKQLYDQTESFLAPYISSGEIKHDYRDIPLNEENIGSYTARQMILKIGRQEITMTPVGTFLIGAKGRVDVVGPAGRTRFVLVDSKASGPTLKATVNIGGKPERPVVVSQPGKINWVWKIATNPPTIQYIELTQESLFQALMEVANG
jgi:hypothetical protein